MAIEAFQRRQDGPPEIAEGAEPAGLTLAPEPSPQTCGDCHGLLYHCEPCHSVNACACTPCECPEVLGAEYEEWIAEQSYMRTQEDR